MLSIIIVTLLGVYLFVSIRAILRVKQSIVFTRSEKAVQYVLILSVPFLWAAVVKGLITTTKGSHEAEKEIEPPTTRFFDGTEGME